MFETPSSGSVIMLVIVLALLYWTFKDERKEKKVDNTNVLRKRHCWIMLLISLQPA